MKNLSSIGKKGFLHLLVIVMASRTSAFFAQWVMGIFLFKEDFGVIAIISIIFLLSAGFKEVGLYQILQEHRDDFEERAPELTASAQIFNIVGVALLLVLAPLIAHYYDDPRLLLITAALVIIMPFNIAALPYKARLAIRFDFKRISRVESTSVVCSNMSLAFLAMLGAGVYSFVASQIVLTIATFILYRQGQPAIVGPVWPGWAAFSAFMMRSKWLVLSSYMNNVSTRGDYLVLSLLVTKGALGLYYFSYQLMAAAVQLIGMALNHLLLPLFSAIKNDPERIQSGLDKAGGALSLMSGALCLSLLIWFPYLIKVIWSDKWNDAIALTLIVTLFVPPRLLSSPLGSSVLEAMARYRERTIVAIVDAISLVCFVWVGGAFYGIVGACVAIGLQRCTFGMLFYFSALKFAHIGASQAAYRLVKHIFPYAICCVLLSIYVFGIVGYAEFLMLGFFQTCLIYIPLMLVYVGLHQKQIINYALKR